MTPLAGMTYERLTEYEADFGGLMLSLLARREELLDEMAATSISGRQSRRYVRLNRYVPICQRAVADIANEMGQRRGVAKQ